MLQLKAAPVSEWQEPMTGLRVLMRPLGTTVLLEAQRLRASLIEADPVARLSLETPPDDDAPKTPEDETVLTRRLFLMSVAYVAAGAESWEGLEDEAGQVLNRPSPQQVRQLLEQEPALFDHFDRDYINRAYLLSVEKNASALSRNTSGAREDSPGAKTPAEGSSAAKTPNPVP